MAGAAELILTADVIRTVDRGRPTVRAMAVAGDVFARSARWANTIAMLLAGITQDTIPDDGVTMLDARDGEPTGILLEAARYPGGQGPR